MPKNKNFLFNNNILQKLLSKNFSPFLTLWSRSLVLTSDLLNFRLKVHNGKTFVPLLVTYQMLGYKVGEFVPTRARYEFKKKKNKKKQK